MRYINLIVIFLLIVSLIPIVIAVEALNKAPTVSFTVPYNPTKTAIVRTNEVIFQWRYTDYENDQQDEFYLEYDDNPRFESPIGVYGSGSVASHKIRINGPDGNYYAKIKVKDSYQWSDWSSVINFYLDASTRFCSDGTPFNECSEKNKPMYCDFGNLVADCSLCSCGKDETCSAGVCEKQKCSDGTLYSKCSKNKPKLCSNGVLIDACSTCGCPADLECKIDGSCKEIEIEEIKEEKQPESKFTLFLIKIATFFNKLFR